MSKKSPTQYYLAKEREWTKSPDGAEYVLFSTEPGNRESPLVVLSKLPGGLVEPPHTHGCNYIEILIEGEMRVGKVDLQEGDVRVMQGGAGYGPLTAGPGGCIRLTIFDKASGSPMELAGKEA